MKLSAILAAFVMLALGFLPSSCNRVTPTCLLFTSPPTSEDLSPGDFTLTLGPEGDQREVILHLPPTYDIGGSFPLLLILHGAGQDATGIQTLTGMDTVADEFGFVIAYPNGSGKPGSTQLTWNASHCCGFALENNIDDVGYLEAVIDFLVEQYPIDANRVYLAGLSNGGMMAYRAGAELSAKVAGIAPVAASLGGQLVEGGPTIMPDPPEFPVAVIAFHGVEDNRVLYAGGISSPERAPTFIFSRSDIPVAESIAFWVEANRCETQPSAETIAGGQVTVTKYGDCLGDADVELVTLWHGCHEWPVVSTDHGVKHGVCANEMMLEFFLAHPKQH